MEKKNRRFNIVDLCVLVLLVGVVAVLGVKVATGIGSRGEDQRIPLTYQVMYEGVSNDLYSAASEHIPSQIMASGVLYDAYVTGVERRDFLVCDGGEWVVDPDHCTLVFTVEGTVANATVLTSEVGSQEVRVGKEHILKTQYLEISGGEITFVQWGAAE